MPPSGYSTSQARSIEAFLTSCATSLAEEASALAITPAAGLARECASIRRFLATEPNGVAAGVLQLTLAFYEAMLRANPETDEAFREAVEAAVADACEAILAIHVAPVPISTPAASLTAV